LTLKIKPSASIWCAATLLALGMAAGMCPSVSFAAEPSAEAKACLDKLGSMPDYCQVNEKYGELPGDGGSLCGPTSLSNTLIWLTKNGYPRLVSGPVRAEKTQLELIQALSSPEMAKVDMASGVGPLELMHALERYAEKCGYKAHIRWKGPRPFRSYSVPGVPDETWIAEGVRGKSNVVLQMGWYNLNAQTGLYTRYAGHWVTLAGYDFRSEKQHKLIIHDPSVRSGMKPRNEICTPVAIKSGNLLRAPGQAEIPAAGYLILQGIAVKKGAQIGVIDGALRFTLEDKTPGSQPAP
jgi:hypothetical protein